MTHPALPHILLRAHSMEPSCSGPRSRRGRSFAETLGWRQGLDKKLKQALALYALILLSTGVGVGLDFVGINPVKGTLLDGSHQWIIGPIPFGCHPDRRFG
jgi:hypothetical protein